MKHQKLDMIMVETDRDADDLYNLRKQIEGCLDDSIDTFELRTTEEISNEDFANSVQGVEREIAKTNKMLKKLGLPQIAFIEPSDEL